MKRSQLFSDLGNPTSRGVRKCPKCSTLNGVRNVVCKNAQCQSPLDGGPSQKRKLKLGFDCVRLVTHSSTSKLYSIRVRDRGPEYRGFVELPAIRGLDSASDPSLDANFIEETTGRCFVESCRRESLPLQTTSTRGNGQGESVGSPETETSITLTIIASCSHLKEAVKCEDEATLYEINPAAIDALSMCDIKKDNLKEYIMQLNQDNFLFLQRVSQANFVCRTNPSNKHPCGFFHLYFNESHTKLPKSFVCTCKEFKTEKQETIRKCAHYYLSLMCFISNKSLSTEFAAYLNDDVKDLTVNLDKFVLTTESDSKIIGRKPETGRRVLNDKEWNYSFMNWLGTVTELINESMHFQFGGKPDPLMFYVPHQYFGFLQQRIASVLKTKIVPSITTVFKRKEFPPVGTYTKFTYALNNLTDVKCIFDTPQVKLMVVQKFVQSRDGYYDKLDSTSMHNPSQQLDGLKSTYSSKEPHLRPSELKTFLKVGNSNPFESKESIPFIMEWVPDVLPKSKVGELRFQFQFGHVKNGNLHKKDD